MQVVEEIQYGSWKKRRDVLFGKILIFLARLSISTELVCDAVRSLRYATMSFGKVEDGEPVGGVLSDLVGEFRVPRPVRRDSFNEDDLRALEPLGVPHPRSSAPIRFLIRTVGVRLKALRCR